jgi:hypothetical protein
VPNFYQFQFIQANTERTNLNALSKLTIRFRVLGSMHCDLQVCVMTRYGLRMI